MSCLLCVLPGALECKEVKRKIELWMWNQELSGPSRPHVNIVHTSRLAVGANRLKDSLLGERRMEKMMDGSLCSPSASLSMNAEHVKQNVPSISPAASPTSPPQSRTAWDFIYDGFQEERQVWLPGFLFV
ncbi:unnamed protein product [Pleuronectes platessa]|uniref:Uncharacterized protein n=1 Tax=Pleuronectes platessa TaxID=8262 RepID=A0A9N7V757_PLEPL|nr:unnamed protein product [Pleuronectes platessa]